MARSDHPRRQLQGTGSLEAYETAMEQDANLTPALRLARDLRDLREVFVEDSDDLRPWYVEAHRIAERLADNTYGFDEEELESMTSTLYFYLGDADLALKDEKYRAVWQRWIEQFLTTLEKPRRQRPLKFGS